jgi:hypothetical protein
VRIILSLLVIVLGLAQIGIAFGVTGAVDASISRDRPRFEAPGEIPEPPAPATMTTDVARRLTMMAAASGVAGGCCIMIGTTFILMHLLQHRSMRSRLGTDLPRSA